MYKSRLLIAVVIAVFLLLLIPVFALIVGISFFPSLGTTSYSLVGFLTMPSTLSLVESTLEFSIVSAIFTTTFALTYAWFIARTDVYGKRFLELLPVLGLSVPLLIKAFAWSFLLNRNAGIINTILNEILGRGVLNFNINTMAGLIFAQSFTNVPLAYLVILPAMKSMDANLEEASRIAGKGILATFRDVTFPIVRPAVFSAFVLAVIGGVGTLEYPIRPGDPWTRSTSSRPRSSSGLRSASLLHMGPLARSASSTPHHPRRGDHLHLVDAEGLQVPGGDGSLRLARRPEARPHEVCGPPHLLHDRLLRVHPPVPHPIPHVHEQHLRERARNLKFNFPASYVKALEIPGLFPSLTTSIEFGLIAATIATIVGSLLSYAAYKVKSRGARLSEYISALPLAFPGVVYGVALFWTFLLVPGLHLIYGTIWPLVIALVFIRLPFSTRIVSGNMVQVSDELEEASQVSGSGFLRTFTRILLPLTRAGVFNSFIYTFVDSLRELGGVIILATAQSMTFTVLLLHYLQHLHALHRHQRRRSGLRDVHGNHRDLPGGGISLAALSGGGREPDLNSLGSRPASILRRFRENVYLAMQPQKESRRRLSSASNSLVKKAKKEGRVLVYGTVEVDEFAGLERNPSRKKYPA